MMGAGWLYKVSEKSDFKFERTSKCERYYATEQTFGKSGDLFYWHLACRGARPCFKIGFDAGNTLCYDKSKNARLNRAIPPVFMRRKDCHMRGACASRALRACELRICLMSHTRYAIHQLCTFKRRSHVTELDIAVQEQGSHRSHNHSTLSTSNMSLSTLSPVQ